MEVTLLNHMGGDLTVVNAARVSFAKEHENFLEGDTGLINYLATHDHWTPFAHCCVQFRIKAPLFVARQLGKHQVGLVWNEVSRRYVDSEPEFWFPEVWRKRAANIKQGSSDEEFHHLNTLGYINDAIEAMYKAYTESISKGMAPEQARMILPQNMMTSWYWTGSLMFFHRVFKQRTDPHAQMETQEVAVQIGDICHKLFPVSWSALNDTPS
jgi:thymidylate synthase (FAD)